MEKKKKDKRKLWLNLLLKRKENKSHSTAEKGEKRSGEEDFTLFKHCELVNNVILTLHLKLFDCF